MRDEEGRGRGGGKERGLEKLAKLREEGWKKVSLLKNSRTSVSENTI